MDSFYENTNDVAILRQRVEELARIRQGYATHLGSSLYEATKGMDELRWGRESLYDGIAACDEERASILERLAILEAGVSAQEEPVAEAEPEQTEDVVKEAPEASELAQAQTTVTEAPQEEPEARAEEAAADEPVAEPEPEVELEAFASEPAPNPYELADDEEDEDESDELADSGLFVVPDVYADDNPFEEQAYDAESEPFVPESSFEGYATEPQPQEEAGRVCPTCGSPVEASDKFCMTCGSSLTQAFDVFGTDPALNVTPEPVPQGPVCPACGAVGAPGNRFCMDCGTPLMQVPAPAPEPRPAVCPVCGSPTDPSFKFCMTCGHKLV